MHSIHNDTAKPRAFKKGQHMLMPHAPTDISNFQVTTSFSLIASWSDSPKVCFHLQPKNGVPQASKRPLRENRLWIHKIFTSNIPLCSRHRPSCASEEKSLRFAGVGSRYGGFVIYLQACIIRYLRCSTVTYDEIQPLWNSTWFLNTNFTIKYEITLISL